MQSLSGMAPPVALNMKHTYFRITFDTFVAHGLVSAMNFITVQIGRSPRVLTSHRICNRQGRNWRDLY
ncbi:hypothetical protein BDFB_010166 [Asbolus verrucosus]|uniref:Uncharacterized protein n=1 Tax=Asbolus verrucosus TaxID=1661398 RepID=A0A482VYK9_ASBVE|nr:hypothetical protein BDFB_010166 [Asbolus verrucosus]